MAKILVTGATGFTGGKVAERLVQNGEEVTVELTNLVQSSHAFNQFEFREKKRISDMKPSNVPTLQVNDDNAKNMDKS